MRKQKSQQHSFDDLFVGYFKRKYINAHDILTNDGDFVSNLSTTWFKLMDSIVVSSDYQDFFDWLAQSEPYFVDEFKLKGKLFEWQKRKNAGASSDRPSRPFLDYIETYSLLAETEHIRANRGQQKCPYRKIAAMCVDILSHSHHWWDQDHRRIIQSALSNRFTEKTEAECYVELFRLLPEYGIDQETIDRMERLMQERNDELNEARASGNGARYFWDKMSRPTQGLLSLALGAGRKAAP